MIYLDFDDANIYTPKFLCYFYLGNIILTMPNNRLALLWRCITGPVLYARYNIRQLEPTRHQFHHHYHQDQLATEYEPHKIEAFATTAISSVNRHCLPIEIVNLLIFFFYRPCLSFDCYMRYGL